MTDTQSASVNASPPIDTTNLPRLVLSGATLAEVKSLAMGAARSRGWMIRYADSTAERLVVGRPADASMLAAAPNLTTASGAMLEVTTLFKDIGGGVEVATLAEVVTPNQPGSAGERMDYTEQFREPLTQSLNSLRERWMRDRDRLARAAPPPEGWKSAWELPLAAAAAAPPPVAPPAAPVAVATQAPVPAPAPKPTPVAVPVKVSAPAPVAAAKPATKPATTATPSKPTTPAKPTASAAKPAAPAKATTPAAKTATPAKAAAATPAKAAPATAAKPAAAKPKAQWSAKAEQYARQRGCKVGSSGAQLIDSRKDGEVYKVPCQGSDSSLIRCKGGTCQGLL